MSADTLPLIRSVQDHFGHGTVNDCAFITVIMYLVIAIIWIFLVQ